MALVLQVQVASFVPVRPTILPTSYKLLYANVKEKEEVATSTSAEVAETQPELELTEIDTRVLQSMIQDGKIDVETEDDMRKLLERGAGPKSPEFYRYEDETDSEFSSRAVQTLTDTKLWKALSAKADGWIDSAFIYAENRAERDIRLLASIGVFTWERIKRDVARALPAAASSSATVGRVVKTTIRQMGSSSSFEEVQQAIKKSAVTPKEERELEDINLYEELNTPRDEIRSVTKSLKDILAGETASTAASRGLRSAAPAGEKTRTERQQRAFQKRKQTVLRREKEGINVGEVAGGIVDTAWEVKRELGSEINQPGYRTETVRNAIGAGADTTSRVIEAARSGGSIKNALFGSKEGDQVFILENSLGDIEIPNLPELPDIPPEPTIVIEDVPLPEELVDEQDSVVSRLKRCIETPEDTWLTADVLTTLSRSVEPDSLREVVTALICARDDISAPRSKPAETSSELVKQLQKVKSTLDVVATVAEKSIGSAVAAKLTSSLYGADPKDSIQPTLLALAEIEANYRKSLEEAQTAQQMLDAALADREKKMAEWELIYSERERIIEAAEAAAAKIASEKQRTAEEVAAKETHSVDAVAVASVVVDAVDVQVDRPDARKQWAPTGSTLGDDDGIESVVAEVMADSDDGKFGADFVNVEAVEEVEREEENEMTLAALRSLDFVFVIFEKVVLVGLPGLFKAAAIASKRTDEASRGGLGRIGWKKLKYTEKGAQRY